MRMSSVLAVLATLLAVGLAVGLIAWFGAAKLWPKESAVSVEVPSSRGTVRLHVRVPRGWDVDIVDPRLIRSKLKRSSLVYVGSISAPDPHVLSLSLILICMRNEQNLSLEECARSRRVKSRETKVRYDALPPVRGSRRVLRTAVYRYSLGAVHREMVCAKKAGEPFVYVLDYWPPIETAGDLKIIRPVLESFYVE